MKRNVRVEHNILTLFIQVSERMYNENVIIPNQLKNFLNFVKTKLSCWVPSKNITICTEVRIILITSAVLKLFRDRPCAFWMELNWTSSSCICSMLWFRRENWTRFQRVTQCTAISIYNERGSGKVLFTRKVCVCIKVNINFTIVSMMMEM